MSSSKGSTCFLSPCRYVTDGRETLVLQGIFLGEPRTFEYSLDFRGGKNEHVPRLWALRKIGYLLEEMRLKGETRELEEEVIRLSKLHGVLTPFTSYLILEEDVVALRPLTNAPRGTAPLAGCSEGCAPQS